MSDKRNDSRTATTPSGDGAVIAQPLRDTQLSLVDGMERPVGRIPLSVQTGLNADVIASVAPLYLKGSVLDVTYGQGKWWDRFTPDPFTFHDLNTVDGVDFTNLPHADGSFDAVCFDPPYIPQGGNRVNGPTEGEANFRTRYGLTQQQSMADLRELVAAGLAECARVARHWVLAKCCDFVQGGEFTLGHVHFINAAADAGLHPHDLIVHHAGSGPGGHNINTIQRTRRAHSYLLVFDVLTPPQRRRLTDAAAGRARGNGHAITTATTCENGSNPLPGGDA